MNIYIPIFLIFLSACNTDLKNPNISFETIPKKAQIGFPINHKVVINDLGKLFTLDSVAWEDSSAWLSDSSKVFIKESNIDTLKNSILLNYQITFWDTGSVAIPSLYAFVSFPDSSEASILKTDSSFVYISSVLDTTMTTVISDKPLKEIQFPIEKLRLFAFFILSLLILYTFYLIRTRDKEKISKRKFFNFNPKSKALKDVEKIDLKTDATEFFVKISEVLRKYFQNNFYIISFEMTSAELKEFFKDKDLNHLLDEIDQVKFAKKSPNKSEKEDILQLLKKVIRKLL
tara:strand:- start:6216 stop:7079 length:864 start_codon:yes stop_codon:yes gene_type:complete